ncbi:membrane protein insertion efficiency factor YidD [Cellulomonas citrea]|uniref:membrane protein insertion efficiency factor YidD n=1 Tax=Cellulomonas citrea TaxID=1909423 RepID=UPI002E2C8ABE|nr:membrane protein insertion efficiency factor YidD [Cellulomonas citrea]
MHCRRRPTRRSRPSVRISTERCAPLDVGRSRPVAEVARFLRRLPRAALLGLLWLYQHLISPMRPPSCRYYPSCSQYAVIAVTRQGAVRGSWLAVRRLARCHPWAAGGVDDVPPARSHSHVDAALAAR